MIFLFSKIAFFRWILISFPACGLAEELAWPRLIAKPLLKDHTINLERLGLETLQTLLGSGKSLRSRRILMSSSKICLYPDDKKRISGICVTGATMRSWRGGLNEVVEVDETETERFITLPLCNVTTYQTMKTLPKIITDE